MSIIRNICNLFALLILTGLLATALIGNIYIIIEGRWFLTPDLNTLHLPPIIFAISVAFLSFFSLAVPSVGLVARFWMVYNY